MARVKRGVTSHARHAKVLSKAKGYYGRRKNTIRVAKQAVEKAAQYGELIAFQHHGFWQCMDTKRDRDLLENLWQDDSAPWKKKVNQNCKAQ